MEVISPETGDRSFYILGMIHKDKDNGRLIDKWLGQIKPHVVTLEFSQYGLMFRKEKGAIYRKQIESVIIDMRQNKEAFNEEALSFLYSYIDLPCEYESAARYCNATDASLHLIDIDLFSYLKLKKVEELLSTENIRKLLTTYDRQVNDSERAMAKLYFDSGVQIAPYTDEMLIRDKYMGRRIGILMRYHHGRRFAHITGWQHLRDPSGVFAPFHPVKVFPYD